MKRLLRQLGRGNSHTREVFIGSLLIHSLYVLPNQELNIRRWNKGSALKGPDWGIKGGKIDFCPWLPEVHYKDEKQRNECMLSRVQFFGNPWTVAHQAPMTMEFSRQEYWVGLPFPSQGDLPNPGTELLSPVSPVFAGRFFTAGPPGKPTPYT